MRYIFLSLIIYIVLFAGMPLYAKGIDSKCFTSEMCVEAKGKFEKNSLCPGSLGLCFSIPTPIKLNIAIGGKLNVQDIGEYMALAYQYFVGVGVIISIVLIMIGGIQWLTAAGSSERLGSAKKRIGNAITGLVLLLTSYLVLQTINPDIVKLTVPRVAMIRKQIFSEENSCQQFEGNIFAKKQGGKSYDDYKKDDFIDFTGKAVSGPECGKEWIIKDAGGISCQGYWCPKPQACFNGECKTALLAGTFTGDSKIPLPYTDDMWLALVCTDGTVKEFYHEDADDMSNSEYGKGNFSYIFEIDNSGLQDAIKECGGENKVSGATVIVELKDDVLGSTTIANDDDFALVRDLEKASGGNCILNQNICNVLNFNGDNDAKEACDEKDFRVTSGITGGTAAGGSEGYGFKKNYIKDALGTGDNYNYWFGKNSKISNSYYTNKDINPDGCTRDLCMYLIPISQLDKGLTCQINVTREKFPDK